MATEEEKKANQAARDAVQVTTDITAATPKAEDKKEEETTSEEETDEVADDVVEETEAAVEASEEKVEELEEQLEDKTLTAKEREKLERRIQKEREKAKALREENETLKKQLAARPNDEKVFTEEEIIRRAKEYAQEEITNREFEAAVNRIAKEAEKIDKDYKTKVKAMSEDYNNGVIPGMMIGILDDLRDHGGDVLMYLANHEDEYEEIHTLSPAKMAIRLKDISDKIKPKPKKVSQVPPPNDTLKGRGNTPETKASEKDDMNTFVMKRNREAEEHRKRKLGLH